MAWQWSHTDDALRNVQERIYMLDELTLIEVYAEWSCELRVEDMDEARATARSFCRNGAHDLIAEAIIEKVFDHQVCDNGGYNAHICPFGCHTVPFDELEDDDEFPI